MLKQPLSLLLSAILALAFASSAQGVSFFLSLDDCDADGCQGTTLFMQVDDLGGSFDITLKINADDYTGDRLGINQVGFGAIQGWTSVSLVSAPTAGWADPVAAVTSSNSLCEVGGSSDKICTHGFVDITGGGDYSWAFNVVGGTLKQDEWHIGGQFANSAGPARGQIISSSGIPVIPEPSAALVFGIGALIVAAGARRGRRI
jgi:hypothetical protein